MIRDTEVHVMATRPGSKNSHKVEVWNITSRQQFKKSFFITGTKYFKSLGDALDHAKKIVDRSGGKLVRERC